MNRRATFTEAELKRAIRAAEAVGKVAVQTRFGIAFVEADKVMQSDGEESDVDKWFQQDGQRPH
ncbi:hypothetical protein QKW60_05745 [Defluviimonas aestuarii]|uniref:hypothetical protein n=1 Tax=Albidovulum aestuarii TaxID=1130726 RepID=UPI00249A2947|nr:hypothetical protein [Defluviimonas aestuarii]MDI3335900.1 hypothetical protein [Defluviimonas aestuarii]